MTSAVIGQKLTDQTNRAGSTVRACMQRKRDSGLHWRLRLGTRNVLVRLSFNEEIL
jgi:hypothetical protein